MDILYVGTAFVAGVVSFLAPCVLPIVPGYLVYIAGSVSDGSAHARRDIFMNAVFFVLGFSFVFALLGVLLQTALSSAGPHVQEWLSRIGGVIVILFGVYLTGILEISFLKRSYSFHIDRNRRGSRFVTSFLFGLAFAAGWSPCAGAVLGGIIALAPSAPVSAFFLLFAYALGLGVPFLIVGAFTAQASALVARLALSLRYVNVLFGILLIGLGILVFLQDLPFITAFAANANQCTRLPA